MKVKESNGEGGRKKKKANNIGWIRIRKNENVVILIS